MRPYRIKARGWIKPGALSSFGQLMLYPAGVPTHALAGDEGGDVRLLLCRFDRAWLDEVLDDERDWSSTGQTLHDFMEDVRVARAKSLLTDTNLPLKVISYRLGFCHPSAFSFAFRKATGEAAREYRQRRGNGSAP